MRNVGLIIIGLLLIPIITVEYLPYFNETKLLAHSMLSGKNYDESKIDLGFLYLRGDGVTQDTKSHRYISSIC